MTIKGSELINELATALSKAQGEFLPARMDAVNPFFKNKYADLGSVIAAAKVACSKYGLAVVQPASTEDGNITVTTMLMHTSGQWLESSMTLPLNLENKNIAQSAGSIITYLRRYSLSAMLGIYADEDTDGEKTKAVVSAPLVPERMTTVQAVEDLGFDIPEEPADPETLPAPKMTLEQARMVKGGKDGKLYGDLDKNDLVGKMIGLKEMLKKELAPEKREEALFKLEAARMLRANFDKQSATPE